MLIATQIDFLHRLNKETDTSLLLCQEAVAQGHQVYTFHPSSLIYKQGHLWAQACCYETQIFQELNLDTIDIILIRQDPPFDLDYLSNTYFLDHVKARVINSPNGIRHISEKLSVLRFKSSIPATLLSYEMRDIMAFLEVHKKIVVKPLYECGGRGVSLITQETPNLTDFLSCFQKQYPGPFLVQEFLPIIQQEGDRRVFVINGDPVVAYRRIPKEGGILANLCQSASVAPYTLTEQDLELCCKVGEWLKQQGVFLAGLDLIGPYLIEINVTSPTGFKAVQDLYNMNLAELFWKRLGF